MLSYANIRNRVRRIGISHRISDRK